MSNPLVSVAFADDCGVAEKLSMRNSVGRTFNASTTVLSSIRSHAISIEFLLWHDPCCLSPK
jgi:hypothetical protein